MKRYFGNLTYFWILLALPLTARDVRIYVVNNAGASVSVIDPATNKVVQTIEGFEVPHGVGFAPDGSRAYIGDEFEHVVTVVDTKTGKIIKKVPISGKPNMVDVTRDGKRALVCIAEHPPLSAVEIIDTVSLQKVKTIPMTAHMHDCYVTEDGKYAVAGSDMRGNFVSVIDLRTEQEIWQVKFDRGIRTMSFENNPDGSTRRIFVQLGGFNGFAIVDFAKRAEVARVKLPDEPSGMDRGEESHGAGVAPDGKTYWINSGPANAVFVYSLPDLKLMGHVSLPEVKVPGRPATGGEPHWVTFTPDSKLIYISSAALGLVSAIDVKAMKLVAQIPAGEGARRINTLIVP